MTSLKASPVLKLSCLDVATALLGPLPGRRGAGPDWASCIFHADPGRPSLKVDEENFHCFGCGEHGDAYDLAAQHFGVSFVEAREMLEQLGFDTGLGPATVKGKRRSQAKAKPPAKAKAEFRDPTDEECGLPPLEWRQNAMKIIEEAEALLWSTPRELAYLRVRRGLADETIKAARLGLIDCGAEPHQIRHGIKVFPGRLIPWFGPDGLPAMLKIRRPGKNPDPKYICASGSKKGGLYPGLDRIRSGQPLVLTEGEYDALVLSQQLGDLIAVATLGDAGSRFASLRADAKYALIPVARFYLAGDPDAAGKGAMEAMEAIAPGRCRRIAPPDGFKDWTEAHLGGVDLRAFWLPILGLAPAAIPPPDAEAEADTLTRNEGIPETETWPHPSVDPWSIDNFAETFVRDALTSMGYSELLIEFWSERAGILEFDGEAMSRAEANREAAKLTHVWARDAAEARAAGKLRSIDQIPQWEGPLP